MIRQKLLEIQKAVRGLQKNAKAYNYEYVSGDKLLSFIRPKMDELGLLLMPEVLSTTQTPITYRTWDNKAKAVVEKTEVLYLLDMRMTWIDSEDGESMEQRWQASGMNAFDKGYGSALTYGERYYLLKTFHIATDGDDVDAVSRDRDEGIDMAQAQLSARPEPERRYLDAETYRKVVAGAARGERTKGGQTLRYWFIKNYAPDEAYLRRFDGDVAAMKAELAAASAPAPEAPAQEADGGAAQSARDELFNNENTEGND